MDIRCSGKTPLEDCAPLLEGLGWFILFGLGGFVFFYLSGTRHFSETEFQYILCASLLGSIILTSLRRKLAGAKNAPLHGPLDDRLECAAKAIEDAAEESLERETREAFKAAGRFLKRAGDLRLEEWTQAKDYALFGGPHVTSNEKLIVPTSGKQGGFDIQILDLKDTNQAQEGQPGKERPGGTEGT